MVLGAYSSYNFMVSTLLTGDLSFRDNIQPQQLTTAVRNMWVRKELTAMAGLLADAVFWALILAFAIWTGWNTEGEPHTWSLRQMYLLEGVALGLALAGIIARTVLRNSFIRHAYVTKGVVLDISTRSWYSQGGGSHTATLYFRFVPAEMRDAPDSYLLGSGEECFDGLAKLPSDTGSFGADLTRGTLISVLYEPGRPARYLIAPFKKWEPHVSS
jgi:hypothetical protein